MTTSPMARLTLERLARRPADWTARANCLNSGVDMMSATKAEMDLICGGCPEDVSEECKAESEEGDPIRAGVRGNEWRSKKTQQW